MPLQRKTQCLRQTPVAKVLWHLKSPDLPKASSQSPRPPVSNKESMALGGPGALWHLKNSDLPNAVSQSSRIPLWHLKSHTLPKAPSQSPEFSGAEFGKKNAGFIGGKTFQSENRHTIQEFCFAEFLRFCSWLFLKQEFPDAKAVNRQTIAKSAAFCCFGTWHW